MRFLPRLWTINDRCSQAREIAIGCGERRGEIVHQARCRLVGDKMAGELERDVPRGRWMARQGTERGFALFDPALVVIRSEQDLGAGFMGTTGWK